jgi:hypothetical protein
VAFTRTYEMFSADFAKVLNALQVIHEKLVSTRNTYQATEDANTARVNQVAGLIGGGAAVKGTAGAGTGSSTGAGFDIAANTAAGGGAAGGLGGAAGGLGGAAGGLGGAFQALNVAKEVKA